MNCVQKYSIGLHVVRIIANVTTVTIPVMATRINNPMRCNRVGTMRRRVRVKDTLMSPELRTNRISQMRNNC